MKKALISPNESVSYISDWQSVGVNSYAPVWTTIVGGERVAEVVPSEFEIAPPLFWVDCADNIVADQFYYESQTQQILPKPQDAPYPEPVQPTVSGAQTL